MTAERAWPFENVEEAGPRISSPQEFVEKRPGSEAVVIRIGNHDAMVVMVDQQGRWDRWVYESMEEAGRVAASLGVTVHEGEYPEEVRVRMNGYLRPPEDFDRGPYPEQGHVGPVTGYPENRPRPEDPIPEEAARKRQS